jgi:DNA-binding SARP family transcriptional activator
MDFRILGPVEVVSEGQQVSLAGQRQRALLAYLLVHANEAVPAERLLDELWMEQPRGGVAALHSQISRLRKLLGDRIVSSGSGYAIRIEPDELDLERFRSLLAEAGTTADPAERSTALRSAEGLWRGVPLDGVEAPFAAAEAAALEELRLAALEDRFEADLELGRNGELISELSALVQHHPLRERLRAQLILALYRSGRQADALAAYRETRCILNDELGLEPSPALRELERGILRHDPALVRSRQTAAATPVAPPSRRRALLVAAAVLAALVGSAGAAIILTRGGGHPPHAALASTPSVRAHHSAHPVPRAESPATTGTSAKRSHTQARRSHISSRSTPAAARRTVPATAAPPARTQKHAPPSTPTTTSAAQTTTAARSPPARRASKPAPKPVTISDTFVGGQLDGTIWYPIHEGTGWDMSQHDGHLEFSFSSSATPGGQYNTFGGHIGTLCKFPANFDARVDYTLVTWPAGNGIQALLWAFFAPDNEGWQVWRWSSANWGELIGSYTGPGAAGSVVLDDQNGTLRLVRRNGLVTAYFLHKGAWQPLTSGRNTSLATIAVGASLGNGDNIGFGGQPVVVDFDNFSVTGVNPICPPGTQPNG